MKLFYLLFTTLFLSIPFISAQEMQDYTKAWEGEFKTPTTLNFIVEIQALNTQNPIFKISNDHTIINHQFNHSDNNLIDININSSLSFKGELNRNHTEINGFIKSGLLLYHTKLTKSNEGVFIGKWNIFIVDKLKSKAFYLSIENGNGESYEAYPIFGDNTFTGTWCTGFEKNKKTISFFDYKTGLKFKGKLSSSKIILDVNLGNKLVTQIELTESKEDWKIGNFTSQNNSNKLPVLNDGWNLAESEELNKEFLLKMEDSIKLKKLKNTHSVLITRNNKLIYENYFSGYNSIIPHDMRSAAKSISSAIIGIIIDKKLIHDEHQKLYNFLPIEHQNADDPLKKEISIHSLLTMSSGLDAVDFGTKRKSYATEDNYQQKEDITKYILEAPMLSKPNTHANYGSANPYLLGVIANKVTTEPLELFIDKNLFQKLNITNYIIQTDNKGTPYFGGGMYLTPRDMLKFGQLYLNKGVWNNKRILSEKWINKSFNKYHVLENTNDKNEYGYLWWHKTYVVNNQSIKTIEARGAGGQYIFILPSLKAVAVITSGNFRNGKFQQPETILQEYILPSLLN